MRIKELEDRIEKKKTVIAKREILCKKIEKTLETLTDKWEIERAASDLKCSAYKLRDLEATLATLEKQLEKTKFALAVDKIPAIEDLLDQWEKAMRKHISKVKETYAAMVKENHVKYFGDWKDENAININYLSKYDEERRQQIKAEYRKDSEKLFKYQREHSAELNLESEEVISKFIENEKIAKRVNLVSKVEKVVGKITDATNLYFGYDSGINGFVIGENGDCSVITIYAGGYNIQCLHFRVLVKKR